MTDRLDRLVAGYREPSLDSPIAQKLARKRAEAAARFVEDLGMERLLQWKAAGDPRFDKLDPHLRTALGFYQRDRAAAKELDR